MSNSTLMPVVDLSIILEFPVQGRAKAEHNPWHIGCVYQPHWVCIPCHIGCVYHATLGVYTMPHWVCIPCHIGCVYRATLGVYTMPHWVCTPCHNGCVYHATLGVYTMPHWVCIPCHIGCVYHATLGVYTMPHWMCTLCVTHGRCYTEIPTCVFWCVVTIKSSRVTPSGAVTTAIDRHQTRSTLSHCSLCMLTPFRPHRSLCNMWYFPRVSKKILEISTKCWGNIQIQMFTQTHLFI